MIPVESTLRRLRQVVEDQIPPYVGFDDCINYAACRVVLEAEHDEGLLDNITRVVWGYLRDTMRRLDMPTPIRPDILHETMSEGRLLQLLDAAIIAVRFDLVVEKQRTQASS